MHAHLESLLSERQATVDIFELGLTVVQPACKVDAIIITERAKKHEYKVVAFSLGLCHGASCVQSDNNNEHRHLACKHE